MVTKTVVGQQRAAAKREAAKAASDKEIEALIGGGGGDGSRPPKSHAAPASPATEANTTHRFTRLLSAGRAARR